MVEISVIIPCYNGSSYIEKCLEALEKQTFKNFDVIIIDDYSIDKSIEVINNCMRKLSLDIKLIKNEKNLGPSKAREKGIKFSCAEWITFCDCDDWYENNYLEEMYSRVSNNNADMCFCDFYKVGSKGKKIKSDWTNILKPVVDISSAIVYADMALWTTIIRRDILETLEYAELYHGEDAVIVQQAIQKSQIICATNKPLYNYFYSVGSASRQMKKDSYKELLNSFNFIEKYIPDKYHDERCFIGIKIVVYGSVLNLIKGNNRDWQNDFKKLMLEFSKKYPDWISNKYVSKLSLFKRSYVKACYNNNYVRLMLFTKVHNLLIRMF